MTSLALAASLGLCRPAFPAELVIIVHPQFPIKDVRTDELSRIFLGRVHRLAGVPINPVNKESGTIERALFDQRVHRMDDSSMREYWLAARIKGEGTPPRSFQSDAAIVRYVSSIPGAIGYVRFPPPAGPVREVSVDGVTATAKSIAAGVYPLRDTPGR